jgi:hypothetical protein
MKFFTRITRILTMLLGISPGVFAAAECLTVVDHDVQSQGVDEFGITQVKWQTMVKNRCDTLYNGEVSIQFLTEKGNEVYRGLAIVAVEPEQNTEVIERISVPIRLIEQAAEIRVEVSEERESPI